MKIFFPLYKLNLLIALNYFKANYHSIEREVPSFTTEQKKIINIINNQLDVGILSKDILIKMAYDNDLLLTITYDENHNEITRTFDNLLNNMLSGSSELNNRIIIDVEFRKKLQSFFNINDDKSIEYLSKEDRTYLESIYRLYDQKPPQRADKPFVLGIIKRNYSSLADSNSHKQINKRIIEIIDSVKDSVSFKSIFNYKLNKDIYYNTDNDISKNIILIGEKLMDTCVDKIINKKYPNSKNKAKLIELRSILLDKKNIPEFCINSGLYKYINIDARISFLSKTLNVKKTRLLTDVFYSFLDVLHREKDEDILIEFLTLTMYNKVELINKLNNKSKLNSLIFPPTKFVENPVLDIYGDPIKEDNVINTIYTSKPIEYFGREQINIELLTKQLQYIDSQLTKEFNNVNSSLTELQKSTLSLNDVKEKYYSDIADSENYIIEESSNELIGDNVRSSETLRPKDSLTNDLYPSGHPPAPPGVASLNELNLNTIVKSSLVALNIIFIITLFLSLLIYIINTPGFYEVSSPSGALRVIKKLFNGIDSKVMIDNQVYLPEENIQEDTRSLYITDDLRNNSNNYLEDDKILSENKETSSKGIYNYIAFLLIISLGFIFSKNVENLISQNFNILNNSSITSNSEVGLEQNEAGLEQSVNLLDKCKDLLENTLDYVHEIGGDVPLSLISANLIGLWAYFSENLDIPIEPSESDTSDTFIIEESNDLPDDNKLLDKNVRDYIRNRNLYEAMKDARLDNQKAALMDTFASIDNLFMDLKESERIINDLFKDFNETGNMDNMDNNNNNNNSTMEDQPITEPIIPPYITPPYITPINDEIVTLFNDDDESQTIKK